MKNLTQEYLKEVLHYDPATGLFHWLVRPVDHFKTVRYMSTWNTSNAGNEAGTLHARGYISIYINGQAYRAHRLAWLYMTGDWPDKSDHIKGNRSDNRFSQLRNVSVTENNKNKAKGVNNTSGTMGVSWNERDKRWLVQIAIKSKNTHIGRFVNKSDAIDRRKEAEIEHGYHANHGR